MSDVQQWLGEAASHIRLSTRSGVEIGIAYKGAVEIATRPPGRPALPG